MWDYSSNGFYYVTICTKDMVKYFGQVEDEKMKLNQIGKIAEKYWSEIPDHFPFVNLHEYVIMPNHVHGIVEIDKKDNPNGRDAKFCVSTIRNRFGSQSQNLASIIRGFKIGVTKYSNFHNIPFVWQPRYYDRIIRNEKELFEIRKYIQQNPQKWTLDKYNT